CPKRVMANLRNQKKKTNTPVSIIFSGFGEDNEKPMDDLVDDIHKKMEALAKKIPMKTDIWSGWKAGSPKRNVVFSSVTKENMDVGAERHRNWTSKRMKLCCQVITTA
ncbi:hypothetical protein Tco_1464072, partial [Tanacetum coccineum]